ncbi:hypothetical protein CW304_24060 [Bacillus sp. UFRGS-B20]|nr:hypothetical protein CW304_24060 [Bacillus sp. UFRGS-B20]
MTFSILITKKRFTTIFTLALFFCFYHYLVYAHSKNILGGYFEKQTTTFTHYYEIFSASQCH